MEVPQTVGVAEKRQKGLGLQLGDDCYFYLAEAYSPNKRG
jgi:hypothetical protein